MQSKSSAGDCSKYKRKDIEMDFSTIRKNLERNRFLVSCFETPEETNDYLTENIKNEIVGFGGSVTLHEMGLYERLEKNNTMLWHWVDPEFRQRQLECSVYISSVNGASETGELVNIDGMGNRIACTLFGPKKVYFILGSNKICPDLPSAMERAQKVAGPLNAKRGNFDTPCVKTGRCHDCYNPERICRAMVVHLRPMLGAEHTEVILINKELGY